MGSSQERAELEAKLARCRDLAREFREGPTADMIRDLETEICESLQRLADAADLADPADDIEIGPCRFMEWATGACDVGNATGAAWARLRPRASVFRLTRSAAERQEANPDHKNVQS